MQGERPDEPEVVVTSAPSYPRISIELFVLATLVGSAGLWLTGGAVFNSRPSLFPIGLALLILSAGLVYAGSFAGRIPQGWRNELTGAVTAKHKIFRKKEIEISYGSYQMVEVLLGIVSSGIFSKASKAKE